MKLKPFQLLILLLFITGSIIIGFVFSSSSVAGPGLILFFTCLALFFMSHRSLKRFAFTIWVFAAVAASIFYPDAFGTWFNVNLAILIVPLIQIIMFGMGTTLNIHDFGRVFKMPGPVLIGIILQFLIMPSAALLLIRIFGFEPEIAAGIILIGSCPGGVASNLMAYLAKGNVALSVTMTSCSTLLSPVITPLLMKVLAGKLVPINFVEMMFSILNMIIVPILAGLVANAILYGKGDRVNKKGWLAMVSALSLILAVICLRIDPGLLGVFLSVKSGLVIGFALIGIVSLAKIIVKLLKGPENWMDRVLPVVSMVAICYIIAIITARSSEKLVSIGLLLICASILHNFIGYFMGYWSSRLFRLDERDCRTVAFEVGMQNGGMASGLAMAVLKSPLAALAPAIFGPWMNVSGSILATFWHSKPIKEKPV
ncbi:bile acid:sodium symporter family protein [Bacteroidota bacterium]